MNLAVLRGLWEWRDGRARSQDRAPFRIMNNDALVALARLAPTTPDELRKVAPLPGRLADRHGSELLDVIRAARDLPESAWPRRERRRRTPPDPKLEERLQRLRRLRAHRAPAVDLDPGLVCPNTVLVAIARAAPTTQALLDGIPGLRRWQREVLGDDAILRTLAE
jgi:ribonuclease D